jgi:hypothetical protein
MNRMLSTLAILALFAASPADDYARANAHRQSIPVQDWGYTYYFTTSGVPDAQRGDLETAMRFVLPSLTLKPLVDSQIPLQVEGTNLWMIDTRNFGWERSLPRLLVKHYPYGLYGPQALVIRADWFLPFATDASESGAYYDLVFGQRFKSRDEFTKFLQISNDRQYAFGLIEGESGVAVQKKRWIESRPIPRGYAWMTRDSAKIDYEHDPLEHPAGDFKHDAEEWIIGVPKLSTTGNRGVMQVYFLSDGKGNVQDKAPAGIVTDRTGVRYGATEIRNGISCIACHTSGLNQPSVNEFRQLIVKGVDVYAKKGTQEQLDAFHLSDINKEITRNNEDFSDIVTHCTGVAPEKAVAAFIGCVKSHDADVTLSQAAIELGAMPQELAFALALASNDGSFRKRLAGLAHDKPILRQTWEDGTYLKAYYALKVWRAK